MKKEKINEIGLLGLTIGQKKEPLITDKNITFIAGYFYSLGFNVHVSSGVLNKDDFLTPSIVLTTKKQPKTRFLNQKKFFEDFIKKTGKKNIKQLSGQEYYNLMTAAMEEGETTEYKKWRVLMEPLLHSLYQLLKKYNETRRGLSKSEKLSFLKFENGNVRLNFNNQINQNLLKKVKKLTLPQKRKKMKQFLGELKLFKEYIIRNSD